MSSFPSGDQATLHHVLSGLKEHTIDPSSVAVFHFSRVLTPNLVFVCSFYSLQVCIGAVRGMETIKSVVHTVEGVVWKWR